MCVGEFDIDKKNKIKLTFLTKELNCASPFDIDLSKHSSKPQTCPDKTRLNVYLDKANPKYESQI